jgi:hypothetical protein
MPVLKDYWDQFSDYTGRASDGARQLNFAGLGAIWIYSTYENGHLTIPPLLLWAGFFFSLSLTLDLLQYLTGAIVWGSYARGLELKKTRPDKEITHEPWRPALISRFFWFKVPPVIVGYGCILVHLVRLLLAG